MQSCCGPAHVKMKILVGVVVGLASGALGAEWWTSRGEFCLNSCTHGAYSSYWCYTVDPNDDTKVYKPSGHPDFLLYNTNNVLITTQERWDYCTPRNTPSSKTSLWPDASCADECSAIEGRSICSPRTNRRLSRRSISGKLWRDDGRCGHNFPLTNGDDGQCDPKGNGMTAPLGPCCSGNGWCGNTDDHCKCATCVDYSLSNSLIELRGGSTASEGNVYALNSKNEFGPVCDDEWGDDNARVVCRQLGYSGGRSTKQSHFGNVNSKFAMDDVRCSGKEAQIQDCRYSTSDNCAGGEGAGVICSMDSGVELRGGSTASEGNVYALNSRNEFGPVCDDEFGDDEARVVCRQLGYSGGRSTNQSHFGNVSSTFAMDDVRCGGEEAQIQDCRYTTSDNCGRGEGAGVICSMDSCFEFDIHHVGFGLKPGGDNNYGATGSGEECQAVCQKTAGCAWFNWVRKQDQCWLKTEKGTRTKQMPGDVTGPKTCHTGTGTSDCMTTPSRPDKNGEASKSNKKCIFPFTHNGTTYYDCAPGSVAENLEDDSLWCSTMVDHFGYHVQNYGEWGYCDQPCSVNGDWSSWGSWSACSATCGDGTKTKTRTCSNPPPRGGGQPCKGSSTHKEKCKERPCGSCNGLHDGCCTAEFPCKENDGHCESHDQCKGDLVCGTDNCVWGDGDNCCFKKEGHCKGREDCCTFDSPCKENDGDCDSDDECEGDLVCGTNNCLWGGGDGCCMKNTEWRDSVKLSSDGDAGKYQKKRMGTYFKTDMTDQVKHYPVYELDHKVNNKAQYLFAYHADKSWRVGPSYMSIRGTKLKSTKEKLSPTPHTDGWLFQQEGTWVKQNRDDKIIQQNRDDKMFQQNRTWVKQSSAPYRGGRPFQQNATWVKQNRTWDKRSTTSHRDGWLFQQKGTRVKRSRPMPERDGWLFQQNGTWVKQNPTPHRDGWLLQQNGTWVDGTRVKRSGSTQDREDFIFHPSNTWIRDNKMKATFNVALRGMVNISSTGNANVEQKSLMGAYTQLRTLVNGYPVYRKVDLGNLTRIQYLFVHEDDQWRIGPDGPDGTGLRNTKEGSLTPPRNNWMYEKDGAFMLDETTTAAIKMERKDWFYCSQNKPLKREQVSAVLRLWCIGSCTRSDGSDFTCPTMFGRDKCSPQAGLNVNGEECESECQLFGDNYKCYMDKRNNSNYSQLNTSYSEVKSELCGNHMDDITQKHSLEIVHGKICAGLCEFPDPEEKHFKVCKVVSWEWTGHQSELRLKEEVCWGKRPTPPAPPMPTGVIVGACVGAIIFLLCCIVGAVFGQKKR